MEMKRSHVSWWLRRPEELVLLPSIFTRQYACFYKCCWQKYSNIELYFPSAFCLCTVAMCNAYSSGFNVFCKDSYILFWNLSLWNEHRSSNSTELCTGNIFWRQMQFTWTGSFWCQMHHLWIHNFLLYVILNYTLLIIS